ncbi:unnamed protein product [Amoebophrya sp. A120]|nr:unnamed protein product [Amoebophrya sp. A120]|eukprot:GSA120T00000150001.1
MWMSSWRQQPPCAGDELVQDEEPQVDHATFWPDQDEDQLEQCCHLRSCGQHVVADTGLRRSFISTTGEVEVEAKQVLTPVMMQEKDQQNQNLWKMKSSSRSARAANYKMFSKGFFLTATLLSATSLVQQLPGAVEAQNSINIHAKLTVGKKENTTEILEQAVQLGEFAKKEKMHSSLTLFLDNMLEQLRKLNEAANTVKETVKKEKAVSFTVGKYKLKELKKLRAKPGKKQNKMTEISVEDYEKKHGKKLEFQKPFLVKNGASLFENFAEAREQFTAEQFSTNEYLEKNTVLEYFPPDQPRQKVVGNRIYFTEPNLIPFSRYLTNCYLGSPAAPKIPGQATEHCEHTLSARKLVEKEGELDALRTKLPKSKTPIVDNVFHDWERAAKRIFTPDGGNSSAVIASELQKILGKKEGSDFLKQQAAGDFRYFVFGPSGSGDKLHAENGLPFYDVLLHGFRRWLLVTEDEVQQVAEKAREALEFQQTSAYMFFEEKLPELKEEFGLKKYIEVNQEPGDIIFVPPGWFRVSLSLADSISYYEQLLYQPPVVEAIVRNTVWNPQHRQFNLAFCYEPEDAVEKIKAQETKFDRLNEKSYQWLDQQVRQVQDSDVPQPVLSVLSTCAKILNSKGKISKLIDVQKTKCSEQVWKSCRERLVAKTSKKVKLDWLPEEISQVEAMTSTPSPVKTEL